MMQRCLTMMAVATLVACGGREETPARVAQHATPSDTSMAQWENRNYALAQIRAEELAPLSLDQLQRVRAIIFGMRGRVFEDSTLQAWLETRPWYRADTTFTNERLSRIERASLDLVRYAEATKHPQIEPGDMRFYQTRVITSAMLGKHNPQDWEVLEAEVLANHGYIFDRNYDATFEDRALDQESLQGYFNERYWYAEDPDFDASDLSPIEQQNLDTITLAITRQNGRRLSPGMMKLFQSTALTDTMLANVSIADLRILRNEIYARHGRPFKTAWIAEQFRRYPWYKPRPDYSDAELSSVEKANIALITSREQRLHESLALEPLKVSDVLGLRPDDARYLRNEIYARHGRRFRDPKLQSYFSSFAWYKPSDSFREADLNATERSNADLISQYESGRFTEG